jgi:hypothetical protein
MKSINYKNLDDIKYKPLANFHEKLQETPLYRHFGRHFGAIHGGSFEYEGELYQAEMYSVGDHYVRVKHIDTGIQAFTKYELTDPNNHININCKMLAHKLLDDWIKQTKRIHYGVQEEVKT